MPLIIENFTWSQSESYLFIKVPLQGVKMSQVDVFAGRSYVKVSYPPYFFEAYPWAKLDPTRSKCFVNDSGLQMELRKEECATWPQLNAELTKEMKRERRKQALDEAQREVKEDAEKKSKEKHTRMQFSVKEQMRWEEAERQRIEKWKTTEKDQAMKELEEWKQKRKMSNAMKTTKGEIFPKVTSQKKSNEMFTLKDSPPAVMAPVRSSGFIQVSFTPRVFPTPQRESYLEQEEEWLRKQAESRRQSGWDPKDPELRLEEKDLNYLQEKAAAFMQAGNFLGAESAYSHALRLAPNMPALYAARAAANLALNNLHRALEDSSKALELLEPPVAANAKARCACHARRGAALMLLGLASEALEEYKAAIKIQPNNKQLQRDLKAIHRKVQSSQ